jgi:uncharacterized membrane protein YcgQ (UPF0703/DUF1980 family)
MGENKSVRNCFIIVAVILSLTVPFFTIYYARIKRNNIENVIKEYGTVEENIRYAKAESNNGVIEIKEKMFLNQVNDVYLNADDYLEKTIKLEGLFKIDQGYEKAYYFVIRYGPGCCGFDGNAGFEVSWANEKANLYPPVDSWVEATGVLKSYAEDGYMQYLYLDLSSLNVLEKRGAEFVNQ